MNKICVIGLGYVGLPLAHAFSFKYQVVGFDISKWRIDELSSGHDRTLELSKEQVNEAIKNGMSKKKARALKKGIKDGYDCAKWLVEYCIDYNKELPLYNIQSANPVGKENIDKLLKNFKNAYSIS